MLSKINRIMSNTTIRRLIYGLLSFGIYMGLNEFFFHIGLIFSERRLVIYPYLIGNVCINKGFDAKTVILFSSFLLSRIIFIFFTKNYLSKKILYLDGLLGIYTVTDFLLVIFSCIFSFINWDAYFYTAYPILVLKKISGYPSWLFFLCVGLICISFYHYFFRKTIIDYLYFSIYSFISFFFSFVVYYLFLGRIIYV